MWSKDLAKNRMKKENDSPASRGSLSLKLRVGSERCKTLSIPNYVVRAWKKPRVFWGVATSAVALFMGQTYMKVDVEYFQYFSSVVVVIAEHIANLLSQMICSRIVGASFHLVVLASTARVLRCTPGWRRGCMGSSSPAQLAQDFP